MRKIFLLIFGGIFPALLLLLCASPLYARASYTFAVCPMSDLDQMHEAFQSLADVVASETGWEMRVILTRDYEEMRRRLEDGSVDFAIINSFTYIRLASRVSYVATHARWDGEHRKVMPYYYSFIISLKDGPVKTLRDLENRNFGFTDRESTTGHRIPRLMLRSAGIDPERFFRKVFYLGRHDRVIESLLAGSIEGGAVSEYALEGMIAQRGELFRILSVSGPVPSGAVVASSKVEEEHVEILRKLLLSLSPDAAPMRKIRELFGWPAAGFIFLEEESYDILRALYSASEISISADEDTR